MTRDELEVIISEILDDDKRAESVTKIRDEIISMIEEDETKTAEIENQRNRISTLQEINGRLALRVTEKVEKKEEKEEPKEKTEEEKEAEADEYFMNLGKEFE